MGEHYADPTARVAIQHVSAEEKHARKIMRCIRSWASANGYTVGALVVTDDATGRRYEEHA